MNIFSCLKWNKIFYVLKATRGHGLADYNHRKFFSNHISRCHSSKSYFAILSSRAFLTFKMICFVWQALIEQTKLVSFKSYFERSVGNVVSFQGATICFVTDLLSPPITLKLIEEKKSKMENFSEKSRINLKLGKNYMMKIEP